MACHPDPVTLPVHCTHCGGAVELECEYATPRETLIPASYACPYCQKVNAFALAGRVLWAVKRDATLAIRCRRRCCRESELRQCGRFPTANPLVHLQFPQAYAS